MSSPGRNPYKDFSTGYPTPKYWLTVDLKPGDGLIVNGIVPGREEDDNKDPLYGIIWNVEDGWAFSLVSELSEDGAAPTIVNEWEVD